MRPIESCCLVLCHRRKRGTTLASSSSSAAPTLAAALISTASMERLGPTSAVLVSAPSINLVLGCDGVEWLLHREGDLLHRMGLCDWMGLCDRQSRNLHLES